ncbi:MAG: acyltransferase [Lachnospiraceae bacterium]|nr:acyltransferase [Lachnospiraceae bacterium]
MSNSLSIKKRLNYIDLYKGICILLIIFTHYDWSVEERRYFGFPFWVDMAVPVFMIISGYLYALTNNGKSLSVQYNFLRIISKWIRFIIPFSIVWILELIVHILTDDSVTVGTILFNYVTGGNGPGSYYFPVMIQFVIIAPMILKLIEKYNIKGLAACFVINLFFEILKNVINMSVDYYRLSAIKYIFVIAYGIYLYFEREKPLSALHIIFSIVGGLYIIIYCYAGVIPLITSMWTGTSMFACMFIFGIMKWLILYDKVQQPFLELLGKASFNIFLVQMFYYWPIDNIVNGIFHNRIIQLSMGFIFSIVIGLLFYKFENPITTRVIKNIKSQ